MKAMDGHAHEYGLRGNIHVFCNVLGTSKVTSIPIFYGFDNNRISEIIIFGVYAKAFSLLNKPSESVHHKRWI